MCLFGSVENPNAAQHGDQNVSSAEGDDANRLQAPREELWER
jgi:hypothetical protein